MYAPPDVCMSVAAWWNSPSSHVKRTSASSFMFLIDRHSLLEKAAGM
jgi:hypothetical protein